MYQTKVTNLGSIEGFSNSEKKCRIEMWGNREEGKRGKGRCPPVSTKIGTALQVLTCRVLFLLAVVDERHPVW